MTKCADIANYIEKLAPRHLACDWDNVGLLVGDMDKEIKKVLICLDNDEYVVNEAAEIGADMIVSHHPIMFSPINRMIESDPQQRMIRRMCQLGICHYAAHTNMDCANGGLNDYLAEKLGLKNTSIAELTDTDAGFGRLVELDNEITLLDMIATCEKNLNIDSVKYVGELDRKVKKVALNSGSGSDILDMCIENGIDLLITGDVKYSVARKAYENGIALIDAGHYGTEVIFTELIKNYLEKEFKDVELVISRANVSVLKNHIR
ncbi:MAG: Nif3-like dinuclear metal center hexameric protein [Clostridia bacterium]|nr:Nif3-like dinuclear metal center hexameric protein [Clostridia bacterium]